MRFMFSALHCEYHFRIKNSCGDDSFQPRITRINTNFLYILHNYTNTTRVVSEFHEYRPASSCCS